MTYDNIRPGKVGLTIATCVLALAGCDLPPAMGSANGVIAATDGDGWLAIRDDVEEALEPRTFTVRDERMFRVTFGDPRGDRWGRLREFRRVLLIGEPDDPWMQEAVREAGESVSSPPAVAELRNVWSRGQQVIVAVLPPGSGPEAVLPLLDDVGEILRDDFRRWVYRRMSASGMDTARANSLERNAGFRLLVPRVYRSGEVGDDMFVFRNDNPDPSQLIRSVLVTWRPGPTPDADVEEALAWREEIAAEHHGQPQVTETDRIESAPVRVGGATGVQIQGVWTSPPGAWPGGGPFRARLLSCPEQDRTYLIDSWVYAPARDKHEYLLQLEAILNTFSCENAMPV